MTGARMRPPKGIVSEYKLKAKPLFSENHLFNNTGAGLFTPIKFTVLPMNKCLHINMHILVAMFLKHMFVKSVLAKTAISGKI